MFFSNNGTNLTIQFIVYLTYYFNDLLYNLFRMKNEMCV